MVPSATPTNLCSDTIPDSMSSNGGEAEDDGRASTAVPLPPSPITAIQIDGILAYLDQLDRLETQVGQARVQLTQRRTRHDKTMAQKRAVEDERYQLVLAARQRQDQRIAKKRSSEDAVYSQFYHDCDRFEHDQRRRLKLLKRGTALQDDESASLRMSQPSLAALDPDRAEYSLWHDVLAGSDGVNPITAPEQATYKPAATCPSASDLMHMSEEEMTAAALLARSFGQVCEEDIPDSAHEYCRETGPISPENAGELTGSASCSEEIMVASPSHIPRKSSDLLHIDDMTGEQ